MDPTRHRRLSDIFSRCLDLGPEERAAFLDEACGADEALRTEVLAMLQADTDAPAFLAGSAAAELAQADALDLPLRLGDYELLRELGRGGMATVYLAQQQSPRREVAVKLMHPSLGIAGSRERFAMEAELLGRLEHPGIAQVFESGVAELHGRSQPFFAMERIEGVDLIEYGRREQLTVAAKLGLVAAVCDAVHHAHQKGVLHRDLKPANILVTHDGRPKVLDFGVGRMLATDAIAADGRTQPGTVVGTLAYMSPEQADGHSERVDTRSDVYSLGVVLYELLSGTLPIAVDAASLTETVRRIGDATPQKLGQRDAALRGDIETIAAKALAKEPERRYASAAALAEDLRRTLAAEPVLARPATLGYRARKFVARNRGLSAGVATAVTALVVATALSIQWALRAEESAELARRAEQRATTEASTNAEVVAFVERLFGAAMPQVADGEELTARQVVETGRSELDGRFAPDSWAGARLQVFFGRVLLALGDYEAAAAPIEAGLTTLESIEGADHPRVLEALADRAQILSRGADAGPATALYHDVLRRAAATGPGVGPGVDRVAVRCHLGLGYLARAQEDFESAEQHFRAAIAAMDQLSVSATERAKAQLELASVLTLTGRLDAAVRVCDAARAAAETDAPLLFRSKLETTVGILQSRRRDAEAAEAAFRAALAFAERALDADHPSLAQLLVNLGSTLGQTGQGAESETALARAAAICAASPGVPLETRVQALQNLGNCYAAKGDVDGAMTRWEQALEHATRLAGADSLAAASLYSTMAWGHAQRGDLDAANALEARADKIRAGAAGR